MEINIILNSKKPFLRPSHCLAYTFEENESIIFNSRKDVYALIFILSKEKKDKEKP